MIIAVSVGGDGAPVVQFSLAPAATDCRKKVVTMPSLQTSSKYPLHAAIRDTTLTEDAVTKILREAYAKDQAFLSQVDDEGRTPIAVAAISANLPVVMTLLDLSRRQMEQGDDVLGVQVADNLQETAASHNLRILGEDPRFRINTLLQMASRGLSDGFIKHRLPPCVCGKCTDGWFSPRMRFRLRGTSPIASSRMLAHCVRRDGQAHRAADEQKPV